LNELEGVLIHVVAIRNVLSGGIAVRA